MLHNENNLDCMKVDFSIFGDTEKFTHNLDLSNATLSECIDMYSKYKSSQHNNHRKFSAVKKHIEDIEQSFGIKIMPLVVGDVFWAQFHKYLKEKGLHSSTINSFSSRITTVLKWSANYGAKLSPTFDDYSIPDVQEKPIISLSQDDVSRITYFDIDSLPVRRQHKETLKRVRDQFVLSCFLGQRHSDMVRITPECFSDGKFTIIQQKTGNKSVVDIKKMAAYPKVVMEILEKYNYTSPYTKSISIYNRHLHELFRLAGFTQDVNHEYKENGVIKKVTYKAYELVSSHTGRRSMISNAVSRGMHTEQIRRASGHKSEKAFAKYVIWND